MRKFAMTSLAVAAALTAGAVMATETEDEGPLGLGDPLTESRIDIRGGVFFPPMSLAATGDQFFIRNQEEIVHTATAIDGSWTTGPIQPGAQATVVVTADMMRCFQSADNVEYKGAFGSVETGEAPECFELSGAGDGTATVTD